MTILFNFEVNDYVNNFPLGVFNTLNTYFTFEVRSVIVSEVRWFALVRNLFEQNVKCLVGGHVF